MTTPAQTSLDLPNVAFFGRTFDEYTRFFALDPGRLRKISVLDVAAGPASFTVEACRRGVDAVAVDPLYREPVETLVERVRNDYERMFAQIRSRPRLFKLRAFRSIEAAEAERKLAAERFLVDYETNNRHGRYVAANLPRLPFLDRAFDLVLCAHLLFVYPDRFDLERHLAACRELTRVALVEVRIHPLCGPDGKPSPLLEPLRRALAARGVASEVRRVDYEFFSGTASMLVLDPPAA